MRFDTEEWKFPPTPSRYHYQLGGGGTGRSSGEGEGEQRVNSPFGRAVAAGFFVCTRAVALFTYDVAKVTERSAQ